MAKRFYKTRARAIVQQVDRALALHAAKLGSVLGIPHGPLSLPGVSPDHSQV